MRMAALTNRARMRVVVGYEWFDFGVAGRGKTTAVSVYETKKGKESNDSESYNECYYSSRPTWFWIDLIGRKNKRWK
jgi:hypothetical protein